MKEELITFETAKLAKEKGFDWETTKCYQLLDDGSIIKEEEGWDYQIITKINRQLTNWNKTTLHTSSPTQSLLQKWLREEHKIEVICTPKVIDVYACKIYDISEETINILRYWSVTHKNAKKTYEEALEKGLEEALKLIK